MMACGLAGVGIIAPMSTPPRPSAESDDALLAHLRLLPTDRPAAAERLVAWFLDNYRPLARWLLRGRPAVARFEESGDLLQEAAVKLHRALSAPTCTPADPRHFHNLCVLQMKRQLGDFADRHLGPTGPGQKHATPGADSQADPLAGVGESTNDPARLIDWTLLHEQVAALPALDRAVFEACFYDGLTQPQAADRLGIPVSQVKRRWRAALLRLQEVLGDIHPPPGSEA